MKKLLVIVTVAFSIAACNSKKTETTETADSLKMDSITRADVPAPAALAFSLMPGYTARSTVALADTVNFILLANQEDIDKNFVLDKSASNAIVSPDFTINHIIGVVCLPRMNMTAITLDKVEVGESSINVYVNIRDGEAVKIAMKPAQIFAIEKRDGFGTVQFYVNGKIDKSFFLTGM